MLTIEQIDTRDKAQVRRFTRLPFRLYANNPYWVPPLLVDSEMQLNRKKHPYYGHSDADFFIAVRDGRDVGRICALENKSFNQYHKTRKANFYLFECENDMEAAAALYETVFGWARARGLDTIVGPKGFGALDGYGFLIEGFERRQTMNMLNYNFDYYPKMAEALGFEKEVDFITCYIHRDTFKMPERVHSIAQRVEERGVLKVHRFENKKDLRAWAQRIGEAYNKAFVNNWEYFPLTQREIDFILDNIMLVADPRLIKIITHDDKVVGFVFAFLDVSAAMQRAKGRLLPFGIFDLLLEMRRTDWLTFNGAGILPEFQGRGGNALMYTELEKTLQDYTFHHGELTQVAESAVNMRADLINLGGQPIKNHRVYHKSI